MRHNHEFVFTRKEILDFANKITFFSDPAIELIKITWKNKSKENLHIIVRKSSGALDEKVFNIFQIFYDHGAAFLPPHKNIKIKEEEDIKFYIYL